MEAADLDDVLALEHELFPDDAWTPQMFAGEITQPPESRLYLVAERRVVRKRVDRSPLGPEPGLAGYAGMMFSPGAPRSAGGSADVLTIAVATDSWGQGIGSALLGALVDEARRRECAEVFLEVREDNPRARGLYMRRGFEEIGVRRGYYQPANVDAIVMRKDLRRHD
jgi:ribosomal-protein-alanine N-acetyltransferase